jgi:hypothetical protein
LLYQPVHAVIFISFNIHNSGFAEGFNLDHISIAVVVVFGFSSRRIGDRVTNKYKVVLYY